MGKPYCHSPTWYSSSSLESKTACSTLRCLSIIPNDSTTDFSWVITYSSPAQEKPYDYVVLHIANYNAIYPTYEIKLHSYYTYYFPVCLFYFVVNYNTT